MFETVFWPMAVVFGGMLAIAGWDFLRTLAQFRDRERQIREDELRRQQRCDS